MRVWRDLINFFDIDNKSYLSWSSVEVLCNAPQQWLDYIKQILKPVIFFALKRLKEATTEILKNRAVGWLMHFVK